MKHEEWYGCDKCGKKINIPGIYDNSFYRILKENGKSVDLTELEYKILEHYETDTAIVVKGCWWDKTEAKQLCRSCFKKYQKLLADFLKSEK